MLRELLLRQIREDAEQWRQIGYDPSIFLAMVHNYGPVDACNRAIMDPTLLQASLRLWQSGRLELTIEGLVLRDRFKCLFNESVLVRARKRLADYRQTLTPKTQQ